MPLLTRPAQQTGEGGAESTWSWRSASDVTVRGVGGRRRAGGGALRKSILHAAVRVMQKIGALQMLDTAEHNQGVQGAQAAHGWPRACLATPGIAWHHLTQARGSRGSRGSSFCVAR